MTAQLFGVLVTALAGVFIAVYAAYQTRKAKVTEVGQAYTEILIKELSGRIQRLEDRNEKNEERILALREENFELKNRNRTLEARLREAGIA